MHLTTILWTVSSTINEQNIISRRHNINRIHISFIVQILQQRSQSPMQFNFKRPQTSKSVSHFYRDKYRQKSTGKIQAETPIVAQNIDIQVELNKKWEMAAQKINKDMIIQRILHATAQPFKMLSKIGGKQFKSQPKLNKHEQNITKTRIRLTSKQKKNRQVTHDSRVLISPTQLITQPQMAQTRLKRKKRTQNFRIGTALQKQLKSTNIFFESPVIKIGYNMQFEQHLRFHHIEHIRPDHGGTICRNSIIFFLKDAQFNPNIISEKNQATPIALSIFPEFFDSKLSISHEKRKIYLQRMIDQMNGTYDPERMSTMAKYSDYPAFDPQQYFKTVQLLKVGNEANYKLQWIENIIKRLRLKLNQDEFLRMLHEQWQFFNQANAMCTLDFMLKDPKIMEDLKISPYLNTRIITSRKILYHGGYCRSIYQSWSNYVDSSRKKLIPRMRKYNPIAQAIYGWYVQFQDLQLYQNYFMGLLQESINIDLFRKIQLSKIKYAKLVLRHIWFRGMLVIYHFNRLMMRKEGEYTHLVHYKDTLKKYIEEAKMRAKQLKNSEEVNNFYLQFYDNFVTSLHKESNIHSIQELKPAFPPQTIAIAAPQLSNLSVLLNIQLAKTIENSFCSLKRQILDNPSQPILRLTLIIDRQSIKFLQQQQQILNSFIHIIKGIMHFTIEGFPIAVNCDPPKEERKKPKAQKEFQNPNSNQKAQDESECFRQYPEIGYTHCSNSLQEQKKLKLRCKTSFNFDQDIKAIISRLKQYYQECFGILDSFEIYLPFIKLTTAQKIFNEPEHTSLEHTFLRNLKIIAKYKDSIRKLNKFAKINIFEVNCEIPIRILQERIDEIEYIMEQNYMNIIHDRIESMDADLNSLKLNVHNLTISMQNVDEVESRLGQFKQEMRVVHGKSLKIAEMVMFCLDNKRKIDTIITCYCQIVAKKQQLHADIDAIGSNIELRRPEIEAEIEQEATRIIDSIHSILSTINEVETTFFEFANLQQYLSNLRALQPSIDQLYLTVRKCQQCSHMIRNSRHALQQRMNFFLKQRERFALIIEYWQSFFDFATYYKQISKLEVLKINYPEFINNIQQSETVIAKIKTTEELWWDNTNEKSQWKPIIHHTHDYYSKKFSNEVQLCRQLQQPIQLLTNNKVKDRHWQLYRLEEFSHITFRELCKLQPHYKREELNRMNEEVNFEYAIYLEYELIERQIRNHQLLIVDLNCSDVLDLQNLTLCLEFLYNIQIDIDNLIAKDVNSYYATELQQLLTLTNTTHAKLESWGELQKKYIGLLQYHVVNEDYERNLFEHLMDLHRKLVKSYDIDNSIIFISKNIVMDNYLAQIQDEITELDSKINTHLALIRNEYPRLYLLNNQQLFTFMSADADLEHYLTKCFPHIHRFVIRQGSIEKVGTGRDLTFTEPLYIQEMIGRVSTWMFTLEEMIKSRMKEFYKTNLILSEGHSTVELETNFYQKYPVQLAVLEQFSLFTESAEDAIATGHLQTVLNEMKDRTEQTIKEKKETWRILLLISLRDIASRLSQEEGLTAQSFQWTKYPRFYRKHNQLEPKMTILNQEYTYAFNFLQKHELIYTDNVLIGNCLVGATKTGKTALMKYYAYLSGQELLVFDPTSIDNEHSLTTLLLNYFRVNIFAGNWLYLQRIDHFQDEQLKLAAECMIALQENLKLQNNKLTLNGQTFQYNKNARVFMSISSLQATQLPARLLSQMRTVWVSPPCKRQLLEYYLQSKCVSSIQIGKVLKLCSWLDHHTQMQLELINWIRQEESLELFVSSLFYRRLIDWCIFKGSECATMLEGLKQEQYRLNNLQCKEENIDLQAEINLQKNRKLVVYGQKCTGKTHIVLKSLKNRPFIIIDAERFLSIQQFYRVVKCLLSTRIETTCIILKHALPYYDLIREHLSNYHLIMVENKMNYLHMGLIHQLKLINYQQILTSTYLQQPGVDYNNLQLMLPRFFSEQQQTTDLYQLLTSPFTLFIKIINKITAQLTEQHNINQLHINFIHLLKTFVNQEYEMCVSYLFAVFWSYGFCIDEKKLEEMMREVASDLSTRGKFQKINLQVKSNQPRMTINSYRRHQESLIQLIREVFSNKIVPLIEMIPLKKGKFITTLESNGLLLTLREIQLFAGRKVTLKSNLIYNIATLRQHYKGTIVVNSRDWLTTILTCTNTPNLNYYNFGTDSSPQIFQRLLHKIKRQGISHNFPNDTYVVIDDVYLCSDQSVNKLKDLVDYNFALFLTEANTANNNKQKLEMFRISNVSFTLGSKEHYPTFSKGLNIRIEEVNINSLFNEYVQSFCDNYLKVDRSVFCLLNLSNNINRLYRDQLNSKYFWFKNPLLLLQQTNLTNLTQFAQKYITYLIEVLPDEANSLNANFALMQLAPPTEYTPSVVNTTEKYSAFYNYSALVEQLVNDHQIMQEIQSKEIESIFFDKFIKHYFTLDILANVIKISNYAQHHHLLLLSDQSSHIERIVKYVCKIKQMQFVQDHHRFAQLQRDATANTVLFVDLEQLSEKFIQQIETAIKGRNAAQIYNKHLRLFLKCSINSNKTRLLLQRYPFLKSHFLAIVLQKDNTPQNVSETAITSSNNIIEEEIEGDRYLSKLEQLTQLHSLDTNFKDAFMRNFQLNRKKQLSKFQFYRKITSQMILNIDLINKCMADIPHILSTVTQKQAEMQENKRRGNEEMEKLRTLLEKWEQKYKVYGELVKYRYEEEESCLGKLNQNTLPLFTRLDKMEKKIEAMETIEFTRLKNNLRNNESMAVTLPLHQMLIGLDKAQSLSKDKVAQQANIIMNSPQSLAYYLKNIRKREDYESPMHRSITHSEETIDNKRITSAMNPNRIKHFTAKMQELTDNNKKYDKVSPVYKPIMGWLTLFQTITHHLKDYYDKMDSIDTTISNALHDLSIRQGQQINIQQQMRNLQASIVDSENRAADIRARLKDIDQNCMHFELQSVKLLRLRQFYSDRKERLSRIVKLLAESEYMKKISSSVSLYFKNIQHIIFARTLLQLSLNQWLPLDSLCDYELIKGIFTFRVELYAMKEKCNLQNTNNLQQIEVIYNLLENNTKTLSLLQDRNGLIKNKLVELAENRNYHVKSFRYETYDQICKYLLAHIPEHDRIIVLHENIHHLELHRTENQNHMRELIRSLTQNLKTASGKQVIYLANYLPPISSQFYTQAHFGSLVISQQRFLSDMCDNFNVILQRDTLMERQNEIKKRRGDTDVIIGERNSKMKELMSNIQSLSSSLSPELNHQEKTPTEIVRERDGCECLQNNLLNLERLEEELQVMQKHSTNFFYQPASSRNIITRELQLYHSLYCYTDYCNNHTNNQFFPQQEFYYEWLNLIKNVREEHIAYFTRTKSRPTINEIVIREAGEEQKEKQVHVKTEIKQNVLIDKAINPSFRKHNSEIFNIIVERLCKNTNWIEKTALVQYLLGICIILCLPKDQNTQNVIKQLLYKQHIDKEEVNIECVRVLKLIGKQVYHGYELRIDKLIGEFIADILMDNTDTAKLNNELIIFLYLYLSLVCEQSHPKPLEFLIKFSEALAVTKSTYSQKYRFVKLISSLKLQNEIVLKLTPPLSLSFNFQTKLNERERIITIIEQQKYLIDDLIQVLKLKTLSKRREMASMLLDLNNKHELIEQLKTYYKSANSKYWVYLSNLSVSRQNYLQVRTLLEEVLQELNKLPPNPYLRIFIILERQQQDQYCLYYNKYEINKIKSHHQITNDEYYHLINQITLETLYDEKERQNAKHKQDSLGRSFVQLLMNSTITDHSDNIGQTGRRLTNALLYYKSMVNQYGVFREEDRKLFYKNFINELLKLGFLKGDSTQDNFYQYLMHFFQHLVPQSNQSIREHIQIEQQFARQGIYNRNIVAPQQSVTRTKDCSPAVLELINLPKIEEYFKNINSEFADVLRKQIIINNGMLTAETAILNMSNMQYISDSVIAQNIRNYHLTFALSRDDDTPLRPTGDCVKGKLPLLRLLNSLKLKEICNSKKVSILNSQQFYVFVSAFMYKQIRQFMEQSQSQHIDNERRCSSSGFGQFVNFVSIRDLVTKMKLVLIEVESYQQLNISEREVSKVMGENKSREGQFAMGIRKCVLQKMSELNYEQQEVDKILVKYNMNLIIGGQIGIELCQK